MVVWSSKCLRANAGSIPRCLQLRDPVQNLIQHLVGLETPSCSRRSFVAFRALKVEFFNVIMVIFPSFDASRAYLVIRRTPGLKDLKEKLRC